MRQILKKTSYNIPTQYSLKQPKSSETRKAQETARAERNYLSQAKEIWQLNKRQVDFGTKKKRTFGAEKGNLNELLILVYDNV